MADRNSSVVKFALGASAIALLGTAAFVAPEWSNGFVRAAWAQEDGGEGKGGQGKGGQGQGGQGQGGQGKGGQGGQGQGGEGAGQGGPGEDSDGQGPKAGSGGKEGGKPVWAQEGIPEVELGRLNVARSPKKVLDKALVEAIATVTPDIAAFYNLSLEDAIAKLSLEWDTVTLYDSPLQSLALLKDVLADGSISVPGISNDPDTLMAMLLGVASDKTVPISTNTVLAITTILGYPMTVREASALATDAEAVRIAVLAGHG